MAPQEFFINPDSPHGLAKKVMLYRYLQTRFCELMNHRPYNECGRTHTFVYFDAFAGPGRHEAGSEVDEEKIPYKDASYGSPLVALHALFSAMEKTKSDSKILLVFEDIREDYLQQLRKNVRQYFDARVPTADDKYFLHVFYVDDDDDDDESMQFVYDVQNKENVSYNIQIKFVKSEFSNFSIDEHMPEDFIALPVISFIDPFGYSLTPMTKVKEFIGYKKEILITLMTSFVHRFKDVHPQNIRELFGVDYWENQPDLVSCYQEQALKNQQGERSLKTLSFSIKKTDKSVIYHLIFFSDELRSLKAMKYGMVTAKEKESELCFTDSLFNPEDPKFFLATNVDDEAKYIFNEWKERACTFGEMKEWLLVKSPYQYHSKALRKLEKDGKMDIDHLEDERRNKALPAHVGTNNDDPDYNLDRPYRNKWKLIFGAV